MRQELQIEQINKLVSNIIKKKGFDVKFEAEESINLTLGEIFKESEIKLLGDEKLNNDSECLIHSKGLDDNTIFSVITNEGRMDDFFDEMLYIPYAIIIQYPEGDKKNDFIILNEKDLHLDD